MNEGKSIQYGNISFSTIPPTKRCLICEKLEDPNASVVDTSAAWLCPECKRKVQEMIGVKTDE